MLIKTVCLRFILVIILSMCAGQSYGANCEYYNYENNNGDWVGYLRIPTSNGRSVIDVKVSFTIAGQTSNYHGRIEHLKGSVSGSPVHYRIHFPVTSYPPVLTSLVVNNNEICHSTRAPPSPGQYITTINLNHNLVLRPGTIGFNQNYDRNGPSNINRPSSISFENLGFSINNPVYFSSNDFSVNQPAVLQSSSVDNRDPFPEPVSSTEAPPSKPSPSPATSTTTRPLSKCGVFDDDLKVPLIYGGEEYMRGEWPWLVAIYQKRKVSLSFICGGSLVSERHVVTAAHCKKNTNTHTSLENLVVKVGVFDLDAWDDEYYVTRGVNSANIHEDYDPKTLKNDILILTLSKKVSFGKYIRPVCLWNGDDEQDNIVGTNGVVAGWGRSELNSAGAGEPRAIRIPVVSTDKCRAARPEFHYFTSKSTFCAGDRMGSGPCLGDSGGGLYIRLGGQWMLRGLASLALKTDRETICDLNEYTVFTDTAKYGEWILNVTGLDPMKSSLRDIEIGVDDDEETHTLL